MAAAKKKLRRKFAEDHKREQVQNYIAAKRANPALTRETFARSIGVVRTLFDNWARRYGPEFGWSGQTGEVGSAAAQLVAASAPGESVEEPGEAAAQGRGHGWKPEPGEWEKKHGEALRAAMGLTTSPDSADESEGDAASGQTLISSTPESREWPNGKPGRKKGVKYPPRPSLARRDINQDRQPDLPFTAGPVRPEERQEEPRETTSRDAFMNLALKRALKEREAFKLVCEVLMREGRSVPGDDV